MSRQACCCRHRFVSRDRNVVQFYGACVQPSSLLLVSELMEVRAPVPPLSRHLCLLSLQSAALSGAGVTARSAWVLHLSPKP